MNYAALKAADTLLNINDESDAATALNAQTVNVFVDIPTSDARAILLLNGDWFKIKQLSKAALTGTAKDQLIAAADICVDTLTLTTTLHVSDDATWIIVLQLLSGLEMAGALSASAVAAWTQMRNKTIPQWNQTITAGDIQTARAQA